MIMNIAKLAKLIKKQVGSYECESVNYGEYFN